jgi:hypothetical protein
MMKIIVSTLALTALCVPVQAFERTPTDFSSQRDQRDGNKGKPAGKPQGQPARRDAPPRTTQPRIQQPAVSQPRVTQPKVNQPPPSQKVIRQQNIQQTGQQKNLQQQNIQQTGQQRNLQQQNIQQTGQQKNLQQQNIQRQRTGAGPEQAKQRLQLQKANQGNYQQLLQKQGIQRDALQRRLQQNAVQQRALQQQMMRQRVGAGRLAVGPGRAGMRRANIANVQLARLGNNRISPVYRGQRRYWHNGAWRVFVPLTALGVALVGGSYLYADGYLPVGRQYCEGVTPDGCYLNWRAVEFEGGGEDWQCVQYCPRPDAMPPPRAVALVAPPPPPAGKCEISIFSEPNFGSAPVTTSEDQPELSESGWADQIASLQVNAGIWEVFTDEQFGGQSMRLAPGQYPTLQPDFDRQIGSLMCVQPN